MHYTNFRVDIDIGLWSGLLRNSRIRLPRSLPSVVRGDRFRVASVVCGGDFLGLSNVIFTSLCVRVYVCAIVTV